MGCPVARGFSCERAGAVPDSMRHCKPTAVRPEAVIKSAASAASPEGFPSRDQVGR